MRECVITVCAAGSQVSWGHVVNLPCTLYRHSDGQYEEKPMKIKLQVYHMLSWDSPHACGSHQSRCTIEPSSIDKLQSFDHHHRAMMERTSKMILCASKHISYPALLVWGRWPEKTSQLVKLWRKPPSTWRSLHQLQALLVFAMLLHNTDAHCRRKASA